ncbi:hypothetical protein ACGWYO_002519 [Enterococcus hirae]
MAKEKIGNYYKSIPYIIEELMRGKVVTIETEDGEYFVYDVRKRVPKLIYYSSKINFIHSK